MVYNVILKMTSNFLLYWNHALNCSLDYGTNAQGANLNKVLEAAVSVDFRNIPQARFPCTQVLPLSSIVNNHSFYKWHFFFSWKKFWLRLILTPLMRQKKRKKNTLILHFSGHRCLQYFMYFIWVLPPPITQGLYRDFTCEM